MAKPFTIKIANRRGDDDKLNVLFTAVSSPNLTGISENTPVSLATVSKSISMDTVNAGRLYIGYGDFPTVETKPGVVKYTPKPDGKQYYGWIEFSELSKDKGVWINLSNVDLLGLPLALSGKDLDGKDFSLGYNKSIKEIIDRLKTEALTTIDETNGKSAMITCDSGHTKIVGPNIKPGSYATFDDYLNELMGTGDVGSEGAKLVITSDTPEYGSTQKVFTGSFLKAKEADDPIIKLTSTDPEHATFTILKREFTSEYILRCDGGKLIYNGKEIGQNEKNPNKEKEQYTDDDKRTVDQNTITNSVFRNILIGMHEGYFKPHGTNYSANYPFLSPFDQGKGNAYAKVLHETSNAYGFPYADSNLKVLIQADPKVIITLTIMEDDKAFGFQATVNEDNKPLSGDYSFGIGTNSDLGTIKIGNCGYLPTPPESDPSDPSGSKIISEGHAYGGFLPTLEDWTQMYFSKTGNYIWIKTTGNGSVVGTNCFLCNGNPAAADAIKWIDKKLTFPDKLTWNPAMASPEKPS